MKSKTIEQKDRVFIEGIPRMEWGKNRDNSFVRSAQLALNSLGENYSYNFLMGISGAAFRIHFHPDFCPSSADSTIGFDISRVMFKSLGYQCEFNKIDDSKFEEIQALYQKIITQINTGKPIVAINLKVCPEWGIITGYLKNRPGILCRTYFDKSEDYSLAEHAPWLSFFIGDKGDSLNNKDLFLNSLKIAIQLARTEHFEEYYSGFKAFEKWIEALQKYTDSLKSRNFDKVEDNWSLFNSLFDSRRSACNYLENLNDVLHLKSGREIIELYKNEVKILADFQNNNVPKIDSKAMWNPEIIDKQIHILEQVLELEKEVINRMIYEIKD